MIFMPFPTGELIGIEYLFNQTGQVLQDLTLDPDSSASAKMEAQVEKEAESDPLSDEGFGDLLDEDMTVPLVEADPVVPIAAPHVTPEPPAPGGMTDHSSFPGPAQDEEPRTLDPDVCCLVFTVSLEPLFACVPNTTHT